MRTSPGETAGTGTTGHSGTTGRTGTTAGTGTSGPAVRPIESRSVAEQVTVELRRSILSGALAPGQEFSLREIADLLQVSFIPVREALRSLEGEGLVVTRPGRSR
jgi:DNA-binding GntR family transcriptional regulator